MTFKMIFAAAALSTALTGAALAQSGTDSSGSTMSPDSQQPGAVIPPETDSDTTSSIMPTWDDTIAGVFFTDRTTGALRSREEAMGRWASLTPEQQARVKQDCTNARAPSNGGDSALLTPGLNEVCTWVNAM